MTPDERRPDASTAGEGPERRGEPEGPPRRDEAGGPDGPPRRGVLKPRDVPEPGERLARSAETGLRLFVKLAALLLWIPVGLFYWLPFLLRRTVNYVFVVLYAGLTGGDTEDSEERWAEAIGFYQLGFRRIVHAFDTGEPPPGDGDGGPGPAGARARARRRRIIMPARKPRSRGRRFLLETVWACLMWGLLLWLTGIWPDAPEAVQAATLDAWDLLVQAVLQIEAWVRGLLGR